MFKFNRTRHLVAQNQNYKVRSSTRSAKRNGSHPSEGALPFEKRRLLGKRSCHYHIAFFGVSALASLCRPRLHLPLSRFKLPCQKSRLIFPRGSKKGKGEDGGWGFGQRRLLHFFISTLCPATRAPMSSSLRSSSKGTSCALRKGQRPHLHCLERRKIIHS